MSNYFKHPDHKNTVNFTVELLCKKHLEMKTCCLKLCFVTWLKPFGFNRFKHEHYYVCGTHVSELYLFDFCL